MLVTVSMVIVGLMANLLGIGIAFDATGFYRRLYIIFISVIISIGFYVLGYIGYLDNNTYKNLGIVKIDDIRITDANSYRIEFIYWDKDNKIQREEVDLDDVRIGEKSVLVLKEKADYILDLNGSNDSRIQYLQLTEEDFDKVYHSIN